MYFFSYMRGKAIEILGIIIDKEIIYMKLLISLEKETDLFVRKKLVEALSKSDNEEVVNALIQVLEHDNTLMRTFVAKSLVYYVKNIKVINALIKAWKEDQVYELLKRFFC